jgi:hypothetical protein
MSLRVEGAVANPRSIEADDLAGLPAQVEDVSRHVAGREGLAVRLGALLALAEPLPEADYLTVIADDGRFMASVPLDAVADALLVYRLGNGPLPREKGGPLRLLIPDAARCGTSEIDDCANVKYVAVLRVEIGRGTDTRPTTRRAHEALHEAEKIKN